MTERSLCRRQLLAATASATAVAVSPGSTVGSSLARQPDGQETGNASPAVREQYTVDVHPFREGTVWVRAAIEPADVDGLTYRLPDAASLLTHRGFDAAGDELFWDGSEQPVVVYTVRPEFGLAITDRWGLVSPTALFLETETQPVDRTLSALRGGYEHPEPSDQSYLGPNRAVTRTVVGSRATYVRPALWDAPRAPPPSLYFGLLDTTARLLSITDPFPSVGYAVPSLPSARGRAETPTTAETGVSYLTFLTDFPVTAAHEFVHTQQEYTVSASYRWLSEGVATFYAHLAGYRHGLVGLNPLSGVSTSTPLTGATWSKAVYSKGAAVCFLLDQKLRELGTDGFSAVFRALNSDENQPKMPVDHEEFKQIVADVTGVRLHGWLDQRIAQPYQIQLPENLDEQYRGPDRPRLLASPLAETVSPGGSTDWIVVEPSVDTRAVAPKAVSLTVGLDSPGSLRLGSPNYSGNRDALAARSVQRPGDRKLMLELQFRSGRGPDSLAEMPPVGVSLLPVGVGATGITVSGEVRYRDGVTESFQTASSGVRATVETDPPSSPEIVPRVVPVDEQTILAVVDPEPHVRYLWRFGGENAPVTAMGPRVSQYFDLLGETSVTVEALDRTGGRSRTTTTLSVTDSRQPRIGGYTDPRCLLRMQGFRRVRQQDSAPTRLARWLVRDVLGSCHL